MLIKQTHRKTEEKLELKLSKPKETFFSNHYYRLNDLGC